MLCELLVYSKVIQIYLGLPKNVTGVFLLIYYLFLFFGCSENSLLHVAFSSCNEMGLLLIAVCGLLIVVASLISEQGL